MASETDEIIFKLMKASSKQAVKSGATASGLPDDVARFLASQLSFTMELVKKGPRLTPGHLAVLLSQKGLAVADLAMDQRADCAITILLLGASLTKAIALTSFTGPVHLTVTAAELLSETYAVDKACGVSDGVQKQLNKAALPALMWLESGIVQWMSRGGSF